MGGAVGDLVVSAADARFTAEAARAAALFGELTPAEVAALPGKAAAGILALKRALDGLRSIDPDAGRPAIWPPACETKDEARPWP